MRKQTAPVQVDVQLHWLLKKKCADEKRKMMDAVDDALAQYLRVELKADGTYGDPRSEEELKAEVEAKERVLRETKEKEEAEVEELVAEKLVAAAANYRKLFKGKEPTEEYLEKMEGKIREEVKRTRG